MSDIQEVVTEKADDDAGDKTAVVDKLDISEKKTSSEDVAAEAKGKKGSDEKDSREKDTKKKKKRKKRRSDRSRSRSRSRDRRRRRSYSRDRHESRSSRHRHKRRSRSRSRTRSKKSSSEKKSTGGKKNTLLAVIAGASKAVDQSITASGVGNALSQAAAIQTMMAQLKASGTVPKTSVYTNPNAQQQHQVQPNNAMRLGGVGSAGVAPNMTTFRPIPLPPPANPLQPPSTVIAIEHLPEIMDEAMLHSLVDSFGPCDILELESMEGTTKKKTVVRFNDVPTAWMAMNGLTFFALDGVNLAARMLPPPAPPVVVPAPNAGVSSRSVVIRMSNMVTSEELQNDADYAEINEDVTAECGNYGTVVSVVMPRPVEGVETAGVGFIFVQYQSVEEAEAATKVLQTRVFDGRAVEVTYFPLDKFASKIYA